MKIYHMKKILLFLSVAAIAVSCNKLSESEFEIAGTTDNSLSGKNAILQKQDPASGIVPVDTVKIEEGKFVFKGKAESPSLHFVTVEGVPAAGINFVLENGSIELTIDKDSIQKSKRGGSFNNEKMQELMDGTAKFNTEQLKFQKKNVAAFEAARAAKDTVTTNRLTKENAAFDDQKIAFAEEFLKKNPKAYMNIHIINQIASTGRRTHEQLTKLYNTIDPELKKSAEGKEVENNLANIKKNEDAQAALIANEGNVAIGKIAPDFSAPGPDGKTVSLKQSMGKVTLIDFWASWCGPCRRENPNVVAIYNELHSKGLNIISVSLDKPGEADKWKKAIADDKLTWTHISNLKHWEDPIARQYAIASIPSTFLLDASGKIVAKNLTGDALKAKIKELLAK